MAWLDSGARRAIVAIDVSDPSAAQDLASWSAQLPASRHRLVASFRVRDLKAGDGSGGGGGGLGDSLRAVMDGLRPVVGCVQVDFEGDYEAAPQVGGARCVLTLSGFSVPVDILSMVRRMYSCTSAGLLKSRNVRRRRRCR